MDQRTVIAVAASLALGAGSGYFARSRSREPAIELPIIAAAPSAAPQAGAAERAAATPARVSTVGEILQLISQIAEQDPARGVAMLNTIQDPVQRDNAAQSVAQRWAQHDPEAAATWATRLPATPNRAAGRRRGV